MKALYFKKEVEFKQGKVYSVCLRGARRFDTNDEFHLSLYTPENEDRPSAIANIESQKHFVFNDILEKHCTNNYDPDARTKAGLLAAMNNVYEDFEMYEVVTVLEFEIQ